MVKKQLMINHMFNSINNDERFVFISHDLDVFNAK
jgi:hypothetical protein